MELIIQVKDSDAARVQEFLDKIEKPVHPHKGIPSVLVSVRKGGPAIDLIISGINIKAGSPPPKAPVNATLVKMRALNVEWQTVYDQMDLNSGDIDHKRLAQLGRIEAKIVALRKEIKEQ